MGELSWQSKARLVAYLQAAFSGISVILVTFFGIVLYVGMFSNYETGDSGESQQYWVVVGYPIPSNVCRIAYIIFVVATGVQFHVILVDLLNATAIGTAPKKALRGTENWMSVTFVFLGAELIMCFIFLIAAVFTIDSLQNLCFLVFLISGLNAYVTGGCLYVIDKFRYKLQMQPRGGNVV